MNHHPASLRDCQKPLTLSTGTGGRMPPTAQRGATEHKEGGSHPTEDTHCSLSVWLGYVLLSQVGQALCWQLPRGEVISGDSRVRLSALMEKKTAPNKANCTARCSFSPPADPEPDDGARSGSDLLQGSTYIFLSGWCPIQ